MGYFGASNWQWESATPARRPWVGVSFSKTLEFKMGDLFEMNRDFFVDSEKPGFFLQLVFLNPQFQFPLIDDLPMGNPLFQGNQVKVTVTSLFFYF
jgi:hypothetical protein